MEKGKKKSKTFIPNLERPIPRRPLANRKTIIRSITFVRNWDSDVSAGGLSFNSDNLHDKSTDHGSDSDQQSISRMIASSPVPVVIASASDVYHRLPAHSEVGEAGVEDEASHGQKKNDSEDVFVPETQKSYQEQRVFDDLDGDEDVVPNSSQDSSEACSLQITPQHHTRKISYLIRSRQRNESNHLDPGPEGTDQETISIRGSRHKLRSVRSNSSIASGSSRSRKLLNGSVRTDTSPQKITKEGAPGQEDTDKECTSVRSSRHKSGRSNNNIASASTRSRKRLNWTMEMNTAPQDTTSEGTLGQQDTDKESISARSSNHKSGRSNTSVRSASTKSRKVSNRNDPKDTAPQAKNTSSSIQTMAMSSSADPGSGVSVHGINQTVHSRRSRKRQLSTSSAESRKRQARENQSSDTRQQPSEEQHTPEKPITQISSTPDTFHISENISPSHSDKKKRTSAPIISHQSDSDDNVMPTESFIVRLWQGKQKRGAASKVLDLDVILNHFEETAWEARQQAESRPVQKAINYFAKTVQTDLREMIAKFARAKIITSSLASSERKLNKKRKELLSVHQTLAEIKHDVAKLKYILKKGKS